MKTVAAPNNDTTYRFRVTSIFTLEAGGWIAQDCTFAQIVKGADWNYLNRMAAQYRKDTEKMLFSIGICPHCNVKLTRDDAPGKEILRCPSCNSRWTLPKND